MFSRVVSAVICGVEARKVMVEADVRDGMPVMTMVGYLSSEVREAQDRVRAAVRNSGFMLPVKRITVNLAPADLRKEGSAFDLAIAMAVLAGFGIVPLESLDGILFLGELSLNGLLEPVRGTMEVVSRAESFGCHTCIVPVKNLPEGAAAGCVRVLGAANLMEVVDYLTGEENLARMSINIEEIRHRQEQNHLSDFADIHGQALVRRACEVAVSGMHNILLIGPPGAGKTMAAKCLPSILPRPTLEEMLEISRIHGIAGTLPSGEGLMTVRPFRSPHHSITIAALAGGGRSPVPGEVSLAHRGVLYLDELPEFSRTTLEVLRQPLQDGTIQISRNGGSYCFPARFMLAASMNPCKCGYFPDRSRCHCSGSDVRRYLDHISGPLLDRIDICVEAEEMRYQDFTKTKGGESSVVIRERVMDAVEIQQRRFQGTGLHFNSQISSRDIPRYCPLGKEEQKLMEHVYSKQHLTVRAYLKILKTARTIADLAHAEKISCEHLAEAVGYRTIDRKYWEDAL